MNRLTLLHLLVAYALAFGIQNKLTFLYGRANLLDRLLSCTYCLGFHCGWMAWLLDWAMTGSTPAEGWYIIPSLVAWALSSSVFCYILDALVRWLEGNTPGPPSQEE